MAAGKSVKLGFDRFVLNKFIKMNVGTVHNYFSPKTTSVLAFKNKTDEWNSIKFDGQDSPI
ncbi:BRCT domain-containing protein [Paenibacillus sp. QZ-Y1]|uniref:BRCT domain-containing protein n=1 Tax=Paenibacillus sp. QZ-Y1 TaxID=3414511 RepID=UPI003F792AE5